MATKKVKFYPATVFASPNLLKGEFGKSLPNDMSPMQYISRMIEQKKSFITNVAKSEIRLNFRDLERIDDILVGHISRPTTLKIREDDGSNIREKEIEDHDLPYPFVPPTMLVLSPRRLEGWLHSPPGGRVASGAGGLYPRAL